MQILMTQGWRDLLYPGLAQDFFTRRTLLPLDAAAADFHLGNALCCAELSRLVYRHDLEEDASPPLPRRIELLLSAGFEQIAFFQDESTHTQAMLVRSLSHKLAILVFRGTEQDVRDFLVDLEVGGLPLAQEGEFIHRGFARAFDSVWPAIAHVLKTLDCPVWVTGHSLGAALATLAVANFPFAACYTFGSPRVGNQVFVDRLQDRPVFRVVDDEDVVCKVPIESMGFRHVGQEHVLQGPAFRIAWDMLWNPTKSLADHAPLNYVLRLV